MLPECCPKCGSKDLFILIPRYHEIKNRKVRFKPIGKPEIEDDSLLYCECGLCETVNGRVPNAAHMSPEIQQACGSGNFEEVKAAYKVFLGREEVLGNLDSGSRPIIDRLNQMKGLVVTEGCVGHSESKYGTRRKGYLMFAVSEEKEHTLELILGCITKREFVNNSSKIFHPWYRDYPEPVGVRVTYRYVVSFHHQRMVDVADYIIHRWEFSLDEFGKEVRFSGL